MNFYDRRLACPAAGSAEAAEAGIALDTAAHNPGYNGPVPPHGASNYCLNACIQFYDAGLAPLGHNIRLTQHTWDPISRLPGRLADPALEGAELMAECKHLGAESGVGAGADQDEIDYEEDEPVDKAEQHARGTRPAMTVRGARARWPSSEVLPQGVPEVPY